MISWMVFLLITLATSLHATELAEGEVVVDGVTVDNMKQAEQLIVNGSTVYLGPGEYARGIHIRSDNVILSGSRGTHFVDAAIEGKGAIITSGKNTTIENIECSKIQVSAGNGACIRHQGENLTVSGVYFHDSEQGILEAPNKGKLLIKNSRFHRLGYNGRAHGVYTHGGALIIENSRFTSMLSQGHAIKSRSAKTVVRDSVISTGKGRDSRLFDISNGGEFILENSILFQSNYTVNSQVIGYGLEKLERTRVNSVKIENNLAIMEREQGNIFIGLPSEKDAHIPVEVNIANNILIGKHFDLERWQKDNIYFESRQAAGLDNGRLPELPYLDQLREILSDR
ncbi:right-handed parallel beta-helix repeat-containing protein [Vibrio sp. HN007]|uniref:right-handed parallel beta-helix repeat-containing protein n=1 Tax=Vibrio iocasae TaxID=3098914 RepID=UPI0035D45A5D